MEALKKPLWDRGRPLPVGHQITFGEYGGKTLIQITEED
ncbi:hypothetical protein GGP81_002985 [Salinibacter ruber]|jgi:hypothetical protein|uniref:Uncharacterized protein n=1 Tax=Salinibacter ruber TaxID=146919 RepID=A0A9X2TG59_9BACT|nr:hypothetical protein [Salinibacter ruber]MCS3711282.1 hypothetical protein [Salinibacter ruber]MCS3952794.1 hypothetical protein [Salinibacter ruber]MCS3956444.1 hypothetical protein [Salinibacter ruber]MCS4088194.1 hypothetical protein [Salinibacter ruber]